MLQLNFDTCNLKTVLTKKNNVFKFNFIMYTKTKVTYDKEYTTTLN